MQLIIYLMMLKAKQDRYETPISLRMHAWQKKNLKSFAFQIGSDMGSEGFYWKEMMTSKIKDRENSAWIEE